MLTCDYCPYYYYDHRDANGEYPGPDFPYCHWEPKGPDDEPLCEEEDYIEQRIREKEIADYFSE